MTFGKLIVSKPQSKHNNDPLLLFKLNGRAIYLNHRVVEADSVDRVISGHSAAKNRSRKGLGDKTLNPCREKTLKCINILNWTTRAFFLDHRLEKLFYSWAQRRGIMPANGFGAVTWITWSIPIRAVCLERPNGWPKQTTLACRMRVESWGTPRIAVETSHFQR